jgi:hypothetical protein
LPAAPVWIVTSVLPSISRALASTSSIDCASRTPPLASGRELLELALAAPAGVDLRLDHVKRPGKLLGAFDRFLDRARRIACGNPMPNFASSCLAWYSWMFIGSLPCRRIAAA